MAKAKKSKGFLSRAASLLGSIPAVGNVRNAAKKVGKAKKTLKKTVKKATKTAKRVVKSTKKNVKKSVKKKKKKTAAKLKKGLKKAKKKAKRKVKKKLRKKVGKVFTKARKLKNNLSKNKRVKKLKKQMKKTVLKAKKSVKKVKSAAKKVSKSVVQNSKKLTKKVALGARAVNEFVKNGFNGRETASAIADFIPIVGNVKGAYEATFGKDPITGRKLGKVERAAAGAAVIGGPLVKGGTRGVKLASGIISGGKKSSGKVPVGKGTGGLSKKNSYIPNVKEAKNVIAERIKGLDLSEHPTTTKQMSSKKMKELKGKVDNRTITKQEYAAYIWNKKFAKRRDKGVKEFWYQEQQRLLNNEPLTRDWSQEQLKDILSSKTPKFAGKPIAGHHSYSASKYPHLADKGEIIYPATFNEHFKGWHGGNWRNSIPGEPIKPIKDF